MSSQEFGFNSAGYTGPGASAGRLTSCKWALCYQSSPQSLVTASPALQEHISSSRCLVIAQFESEASWTNLL
ncbi:hypothetical protein EI94DRAFT_1725175, partial [Lactarius quietus]